MFTHVHMHIKQADILSTTCMGEKRRRRHLVLVKSSKAVMIYYMTVVSKKQVTIIYLKYLLYRQSFLIPARNGLEKKEYV